MCASVSHLFSYMWRGLAFFFFQYSAIICPFIDTGTAVGGLGTSIKQGEVIMLSIPKKNPLMSLSKQSSLSDGAHDNPSEVSHLKRQLAAAQDEIMELTCTKAKKPQYVQYYESSICLVIT